MGFRAAVIGCGAQGRVISTFFARDPNFDEVALFDIKPELCGSHIKTLGLDGNSAGKIATVGKVDAAKSDEVAKNVRGYDILVNAVIPKFNLSLMEASLSAGINYIDMAFGPPYSNLDAQLSLLPAFRRRGLMAVVGAGKSPGLTNLLVAEAVEMLDQVLNVRIRLYGEVYSSEPLMTWSPKTFLEDCSIPPSLVSGGKLIREPPFSGEETYVFPPPVGARKVWLHEHEESYMFYKTLGPKGLRNFDLKMAGLENMKALSELGLLEGIEEQETRSAQSSNKIEILASLLPQPPSQQELLEKIHRGVITGSCGVSVVEVEGVKRGVEARIAMWVEDPNILEVVKSYPMATDDSYVVAATCSIVAKTMLQHSSELGSGVFMPEELPGQIRRKVFESLSNLKPSIAIRGRFEQSVAITAR